ncbi:hypothetical protein AAHE18_20G036700 [Arachis hypogaea]
MAFARSLLFSDSITVVVFLAFSPLLHSSLSASAEPTNQFTSQIHQINLKIAHLESVLEENNNKLKERDAYLEQVENRMNEMSEKILLLQSALSKMKTDSLDAEKRVEALEEEVQLLWSALRRNNFELHILISKAQDTEKTLEEVTLRVEKMRTLKAQRLASFTRCTFLRITNTLLDDLRALHSYVSRERTSVSSLVSRAMDQFKRYSSMAKKYHHQLQGFIKSLMKRNEFTASLANDELIFFLASAVIIFPAISVWVLLSS